MFGAPPANAPAEKTVDNEEPTTNILNIDLSAPDSDTSDSDATATDDDEGEDLSLEDLVKAAKHAQKLLKRITVLQKSFDGTQKSKVHKKKRVHKMYMRFRKNWEEHLVPFSNPPPPPPPSFFPHMPLHMAQYSPSVSDASSESSSTSAAFLPKYSARFSEDPYPPSERIMGAPTPYLASRPHASAYVPGFPGFIDYSKGKKSSKRGGVSAISPPSEPPLPAPFSVNKPSARMPQTLVNPSQQAPNSNIENEQIIWSRSQASQHSTLPVEKPDANNYEGLDDFSDAIWVDEHGAPVTPANEHTKGATRVPSSPPFALEQAYVSVPEAQDLRGSSTMNPMLANWMKVNQDGYSRDTAVVNAELKSTDGEPLQSSPAGFPNYTPQGAIPPATGYIPQTNILPRGMQDFQHGGMTTSRASISSAGPVAALPGEQWMEIHSLASSDNRGANVDYTHYMRPHVLQGPLMSLPPHLQLLHSQIQERSQAQMQRQALQRISQADVRPQQQVQAQLQQQAHIQLQQQAQAQQQAPAQQLQHAQTASVTSKSQLPVAMPMLNRPMVPPAKPWQASLPQQRQAFSPNAGVINDPHKAELLREAQQRAVTVTSIDQPLTEESRMNLMPADIAPTVKAQLMKVPEQQFRAILQNYVQNKRLNNGMAVPRTRGEVPPPLSPPRHIDDMPGAQDTSWQWGNTDAPMDTNTSDGRLVAVKRGPDLHDASVSGSLQVLQKSAESSRYSGFAANAESAQRPFPALSMPIPTLNANEQSSHRGSQQGNHALQDYNMQLMLLEQQNRKRLLLARQEQDNMMGNQGNHALQDYNMQLMLLEQQNRKRLLLARQEQDNMTSVQDEGHKDAQKPFADIAPQGELASSMKRGALNPDNLPESPHPEGVPRTQHCSKSFNQQFQHSQSQQVIPPLSPQQGQHGELTAEVKSAGEDVLEDQSDPNFDLDFSKTAVPSLENFDFDSFLQNSDDNPSQRVFWSACKGTDVLHR
tara:strand:- start:26276 stop:29233 length:2958 start_codon:yes stop_codon:yes gene_type:complete